MFCAQKQSVFSEPVKFVQKTCKFRQYIYIYIVNYGAQEMQYIAQKYI